MTLRLLALFTCLIFLANCTSDSTRSHISDSLTISGVLHISAPDEAHAGDTINVSVGPVNAPDGTPVGLVTVGTHGPHVYNTNFNDQGMAYFTLPSVDTRQPGYMALIAAAQDARGRASIVLHTPNVRSTFHTTPVGGN